MRTIVLERLRDLQYRFVVIYETHCRLGAGIYLYRIALYIILCYCKPYNGYTLYISR